MKTWIRGKDIQETRAILNLLRKYGFNGSTSYYQLSDPKCIYIDFDEKSFKIGCRFRAWMESVITLSELVCILNKDCI